MPCDSAPDKTSLVKILISTDNHLGHLERDPIRGDDSFRAFEEVLQIARANKVDMVLLGGDLFHDNKPSRRTVVRTMRLLRRLCLGVDGDVRLAVRSEHSDINYMDENCAVSLPVFVIHGNHDDPTGAAGLDALSALDLLAEARLITYFGKVQSAKKIDVAPILLQKGATKIALYGLGNIRDELLYDTWCKQRKVRWLSPQDPGLGDDDHHAHAESDDDDDDDPGFVRHSESARDAASRWFNLFVLHQNRITRGSSRGIAETLLPQWLDYVIWGHEHDSIPELKLTKPPIVQPGSTVATSLSAGESLPKHCVMLEVYKGTLNHRAIPLRTVRRFEFADVALSDHQELDAKRPDDVRAFLHEQIETMIARQEAQFDEARSALDEDEESKERVAGYKYPSRDFYTRVLTHAVRPPLVRLRVEIGEGVDTLNVQRFGQPYVGRCATAGELLIFHRARHGIRNRARPFLSGSQGGSQLDADDYADALRRDLAEGDGEGGGGGGAEEACQIPRLVQYYLYHRKAGGAGLQFLELDKLANAVDLFVEKQEPHAIPNYVRDFLRDQQSETLRENEQADVDPKAWDEKRIVEKFVQRAQKAAGRVLRTSGKKIMEEKESDGVLDEPMAKSLVHVEHLDDIHNLLSQNPKLAALNKASTQRADDSDSESVGKAAPAPQKKGRGRRQPKQVAVAVPKTTRRRNSRQTALAFSRKASNVIDDDDDDDDDDIQDAIERSASAVPSTKRRSSRTVRKVSYNLDEEEDEIQDASTFARLSNSRLSMRNVSNNIDDDDGIQDANERAALPSSTRLGVSRDSQPPVSMNLDDDDDDDIQDSTDRAAAAATTTASSVRRTGSLRRSKLRMKNLDDDDDDDVEPVSAARPPIPNRGNDDEEYEQPAPTSRKRKAGATPTGRSRVRARRDTGRMETATRNVRSAFGARARTRRATPTIDLDADDGE